MPRVAGRSTVAKPAASSKTIKSTTVAKLKRATAAALKSSTVTWSRTEPKGVKFVRVPLIKGRTDQYSFTALIPTGGKLDPNKPKVFILQRSGGLAGLTSYSVPLSLSGKPARPLFDQLLTNQRRTGGAGGGYANATEKYPSDVETNGGGTVGGGGFANATEKYPSDVETPNVGGAGGGYANATEKFPSDVD